MKTILCFCFLALVAATLADEESAREKLKEYSDACKAESGVTDDALKKAKDQEEVTDPKLIAHGICILKKSGFMDAQGQLQVDVVKEKFKQHGEKGEKLAEKCAVNKATPEETSKAFFKCVHKDRKN